MSLKAYKFRIYPDNEQQLQLSKTFGCCRFVYNNCLSKKIELYKEKQKGLNKLDCNNYVNRELKTTYIKLLLKSIIHIIKNKINKKLNSLTSCYLIL